MPTFRYRAVSRSGTIVAAECEAESEAAVGEWLKERDLLPLHCEKAGAAAAWWRRGRVDRAVGAGRRVLLMRQLAVLLGAGLKLDHALGLLRRAAPQAAEGAVLGRVLGRLQGGASLADAMRAEGGSFPAEMVAAVRAGEASGSLPAVLERLADALERAQRLRERLLGALIYPAILTVVATVSVVVLVTLVVPAFEPLFAEAGRDLPPATRTLVAGAEAMRLMGPGLVAALVAGVMVLRRLGRGHPLRRRLDRLVLALPVAGPLLARLDAARFCRIFGTLAANGVALVPALALSRATQANTALADSVDRLAEAVRQGSPLHVQLRGERRWPSLMAELVQVGEETGRLSDMLLKLADIFDEDAGRGLDRLAALATPLITLALGIVVAAVLAGLLSTVLSLNELVT